MEKQETPTSWKVIFDGVPGVPDMDFCEKRVADDIAERFNTAIASHVQAHGHDLDGGDFMSRMAGLLAIRKSFEGAGMPGFTAAEAEALSAHERVEKNG